MSKLIDRTEFIPQSGTAAEIPDGIAVKYYQYWPEQLQEITPDSCREIMKNLRSGQRENIYLSNNSDLEVDIMVLESGNGLFALEYIRDNTGMVGEEAAWFSTYDPEYLDSDEETDIECSDGQSILLRKYTIADKEAVMTAIEYFIRTGTLWDGIPWMKSWREIAKEDQ